MRIFVLCVCAVLAAVIAPIAAGSQLIDRNASQVSLKVNAKGEALMTYKAGGKLKRVLAWGAVNAIPPNQTKPQVKFQLDYSGGYGKYHSNTYYLNFKGSCLPYDGPALSWEVAACKAPDGSYWALQAWQRGLPDYGINPSPAQAAWELRLSHWKGELPVLDIHTDWSYHRYDQLFGTYSYGGVPVYGFHATSAGVPLDTYGRNIYVDTFGSAYGSGWKRENSFLTHTGSGAFCYGFYLFDPTEGGYHYPPGQSGKRGPGTGAQYRLFAEGPGVTPDVAVLVPAFHAFDGRNSADVELERQQAALIASWGDKSCRLS